MTIQFQLEEYRELLEQGGDEVGFERLYFSLSLFWWILRAWYNHLIVFIWWRFPLEGFKRIYQGWLDVIHSRQQQGWKRYSDQVLLSLKMIMSVIEMMIWRGRSKCWSMMVTGKQMEKTWMSANNKNLKSSEKQSKLRRIKTMMINIIAIIVVIIVITVSVHQGALLDAGQLHHIHTIRRWSDKNIINIIIIIIISIIIIITIIIIVPLLFPRGDHCDSDHDGGGVEHEAGQILWVARKFKNNCWRQLQGKICVTKCRL